jgi:DnaJ-class molecular chaperone
MSNKFTEMQEKLSKGCPTCGGEGTIDEEPCGACGGVGVIYPTDEEIEQAIIDEHAAQADALHDIEIDSAMDAAMDDDIGDN